MNEQLDTTRNRIRTLATVARGSRSREELIADSPVNLSTYSDFETGKRWPRAITLRRIEEMLGWKAGVIDEALNSGIKAELLEMNHMLGAEPITEAPRGLRSYTTRELLQELTRRAIESQQAQEATHDMFARIEQSDLGLAASRDMGAGINKGDLPAD